MTAVTPWSAQWHLKAELARLVTLLAHLLVRQRERGRTPVADAVQGLVIEPGEAEGLLTELAQCWSDSHKLTARHEQEWFETRAEIEKRAGLGEAHGVFLPLQHAARAFDLRPHEYDALLLTLAVELDPRFGRLVAYMNDHISHTRPTLGLALSLGGPEQELMSSLSAYDRPFIRDGLMELEGDNPAPGLELRLSREMAARLAGDTLPGHPSPGAILHPLEPGLLNRLVLPESVRDKLSHWANTARNDWRTAPPLLLAGAAGSGRTAAARAAAGEAGRPVVEVGVTGESLENRLRLGRRESRWYEAALLVKAAGSVPDWNVLWSELRHVEGPVLIELDRAAAESAAAAAPQPVLLSLTDPDMELRSRLWRALLPPGVQLDPADLERIASVFRFPPGSIARAIRRAQTEIAGLPPGQRRLTGATIEAACRSIGSAAMTRLSQKLPQPYEMDDLVVSGAIRLELELAIAWLQQKSKVMDQWGFAKRISFGRGLAALFSGLPGTGKTMAAQVLSRALGLDIYRIDLSQVMSKYIGETEKNLASLFDEADASGVILFFDEADAIFGKRTEVRDAHDRYANIEIGYLLQRMEEHEGVTILATNRMRDMDEAFIRRFHIILNFPMPGDAERLQIWRGMFPPAAELDAAVDFRPVARRFEISGGEIRNIALAAAFLAAAEAAPIGMTHLRQALKRELVKNGRVVDEKALSELEAGGKAL